MYSNRYWNLKRPEKLGSVRHPNYFGYLRCFSDFFSFPVFERNFNEPCGGWSRRQRQNWFRIFYSTDIIFSFIFLRERAILLGFSEQNYELGEICFRFFSLWPIIYISCNVEYLSMNPKSSNMKKRHQVDLNAI